MSKTRAKPIRVRVTLDDMRQGEAGQCFRCAVALAVQRATGDDAANVAESDWQVWIEAHGRSILAPYEVRRFVREYDDLPRTGTKKVVLPDPLPDGLQPFSFVLPNQNHPDWKERCYGCEEWFAPKELDGEGNCPACRND